MTSVSNFELSRRELILESALKDIAVIGVGSTAAYEDAVEMQRIARKALDEAAEAS